MTGDEAPAWLGRHLVLAIHSEQIAEHGGAAGVRDEGLLESALARPINHCAYTSAGVPELAALYALAIARNHPFIDGNKRTAYVALELFLAKNRHLFPASDGECIVTMLQMAAGDMPDDAFVAWVRRHAAPG